MTTQHPFGRGAPPLRGRQRLRLPVTVLIITFDFEPHSRDAERSSRGLSGVTWDMGAAGWACALLLGAWPHARIGHAASATPAAATANGRQGGLADQRRRYLTILTSPTSIRCRESHEAPCRAPGVRHSRPPDGSGGRPVGAEWGRGAEHSI